jgi:hypothetical protein
MGYNNDSALETIDGVSVAAGLYTTPIWIPLVIVQGSRISQIKKALSSPDLKVGALNCPMNVYPDARTGPPAFGVTVSFHF